MATEKQALDLIVHFGAGRGRELPSHLAAGPRRIVLVDADNAAVAALRRLAANAASAETLVDVVQAAVSGQQKDAELRIYNLERVSGIREPTELTELYPGLRLVRSSSHRTAEAARLIEDLAVDGGKKNKLVVDTPGEELSILQNLETGNLLQAFSDIVVFMSRHPLYKGAAGANDVAEILVNAGFIVQSEGDGEQLTLKALRARSEGDVAKIKVLEKELARVDGARAAHEQKVVELSKGNAGLTAEIDKLKRRIAELEEEIGDRVDRKAIFDTELSRCEMQVDLLRELMLNGREG